MLRTNNTGNDVPGSSQAPGGFITSPGALGTPLPTNYNNNQRGHMRNVVPVTVAQVWKAEDDDDVKVGDSTAHILALVGRLTFVERRSASLTYQLDDMTAPPIEVKLWLGFDEKVPDELTSCFPYARVIAKLRCIQKKHFLHASRILPLQDVNEITLHLLEVVHSSMSTHVKQQMDYATGDQIDITVLLGSQGEITVTVPNSSAVASSVSYQTAYLNSANFNTSKAAAITPPKSAQIAQPSFTAQSITPVMKGLNKEQQMVLQIITNCKSPVGVGYDHLFSTLKSLNKHVILQAVEFLSNEGHIYNTIDDDHFLATDDESVFQ